MSLARDATTLVRLGVVAAMVIGLTVWTVSTGSRAARSQADMREAPAMTAVTRVRVLAHDRTRLSVLLSSRTRPGCVPMFHTLAGYVSVRGVWHAVALTREHHDEPSADPAARLDAWIFTDPTGRIDFAGVDVAVGTLIHNCEDGVRMSSTGDISVRFGDAP